MVTGPRAMTCCGPSIGSRLKVGYQHSLECASPAAGLTSGFATGEFHPQHEQIDKNNGGRNCSQNRPAT